MDVRFGYSVLSWSKINYLRFKQVNNNYGMTASAVCNCFV